MPRKNAGARRRDSIISTSPSTVMIIAITNTRPNPPTCEPLPNDGEALSMAVCRKITERMPPPSSGHRPRIRK
ncbi:hypothetical protein D3C84_1262810 [compost metagenome]